MWFQLLLPSLTPKPQWYPNSPISSAVPDVGSALPPWLKWSCHPIHTLVWDSPLHIQYSHIWLFTTLCFKLQKSCCSVTQSCLTLCDPMDCNTPGLPVHHQLPEFTQTHVHRLDDVIQPSHPLSSLSPPAFSLSQLQGFFKRVSSSHQVAKVLEFQHQSFQWIFKIDFL